MYIFIKTTFTIINLLFCLFRINCSTKYDESVNTKDEQFDWLDTYEYNLFSDYDLVEKEYFTEIEKNNLTLLFTPNASSDLNQINHKKARIEIEPRDQLDDELFQYYQTLKTDKYLENTILCEQKKIIDQKNLYSRSLTTEYESKLMQVYSSFPDWCDYESKNPYYKTFFNIFFELFWKDSIKSNMKCINNITFLDRQNCIKFLLQKYLDIYLLPNNNYAVKSYDLKGLLNEFLHSKKILNNSDYASIKQDKERNLCEIIKILVGFSWFEQQHNQVLSFNDLKYFEYYFISPIRKISIRYFHHQQLFMFEFERCIENMAALSISGSNAYVACNKYNSEFSKFLQEQTIFIYVKLNTAEIKDIRAFVQINHLNKKFDLNYFFKFFQQFYLPQVNEIREKIKRFNKDFQETAQTKSNHLTKVKICFIHLYLYYSDQNNSIVYRNTSQLIKTIYIECERIFNGKLRSFMHNFIFVKVERHCRNFDAKFKVKLKDIFKKTKSKKNVDKLNKSIIKLIENQRKLVLSYTKSMEFFLDWIEISKQCKLSVVD